MAGDYVSLIGETTLKNSGVRKTSMKTIALLAGATAVMLLSACTPTVQVAAPSEPITINMNIKIEHEIRVKVDKELDNLFADEDLF